MFCMARPGIQYNKFMSLWWSFGKIIDRRLCFSKIIWQIATRRLLNGRMFYMAWANYVHPAIAIFLRGWRRGLEQEVKGFFSSSTAIFYIHWHPELSSSLRRTFDKTCDTCTLRKYFIGLPPPKNLLDRFQSCQCRFFRTPALLASTSSVGQV